MNSQQQLGADIDAVAECEIHKQYLETKVPEYRQTNA